MSNTDVNVVIDSLQATTSQLDSFDFAPVFSAMLETFHRGIESNFDNIRGPGYTWPPHSPVTIAKHGPHPLLILTGAMKRSVTQSGAEGRIEEIMRNEATIGTSLFYAPYQQFGTTGPPKIPARRFLWLQSSFVDQLAEIFADQMTERLFGG
jgi:phage gpG-like protein